MPDKKPPGLDEVKPLPTRKQNIIVYGVVAVVVLSIFTFTAYSYFISGGPDDPEQITEEAQEQTDPNLQLVDLDLLDDGTFGEIPVTLATANTVSAGISVGYVKKSATTDELILQGDETLHNREQVDPDARLIEGEDDDNNAEIVIDDYDTTLFYRKNDEGVAQAFSYNVVTKQETQITDDGLQEVVGDPLFSTTRQTLAFSMTNRESNSFGLTCDVHLHALTDGQRRTIDLGLTNKTCAVPVAWSPHSQRLALISQERDLTERSGGLRVPYFYNYADDQVVKMNLPEGYDGLRSTKHFRWIDDDRAIVTLVDRNEFFEFVGQRDFFYDFADNRIVRIDVASVDSRSFLQAGDTAYAQFVDLSEEPVHNNAVVRYDIVGSSSKLTRIEQTTGTVALLPVYDEVDERLTTLITKRQTRADEESPLVTSIDSVSIPEDGDVAQSQVAPYFAFRGSGPTLIGWMESYNELLYQTNGSSGSELRLYNSQDGTDLLVTRELAILN